MPVIKRIIKKVILRNSFLYKPYKLRQKKKNIESAIGLYLDKIEYNDEYMIFGGSDEAKLIEKELIRNNRKRCTYYITSDICKCNEKDRILEVDNLLKLDDLKKYKIVIPQSTDQIKDIEALLNVGVEWKQIITTNLGEGKAFDLYDINLGYSRTGDLDGFIIFESDSMSTRAYTIVALGCSTSDPTYSNVRSWPESLFLKFKDMGINVRIICGGLPSYRSTEEVLKLLRDVLQLKPDLVISYGGVNDTPYFEERKVCKHNHFYMDYQVVFFENTLQKAIKSGYFRQSLYYDAICRGTLGIESQDSPALRWVKNERIMHSICSEFGIKFFGFLQPIRDYGNYDKKDEPEKASFKKNELESICGTRRWYDEVRSLISNLDYIIDLTAIFDNERNIYYDFCHVFERGNTIIANQIFNYIIRDIQNTLKD